MPSADQALRLQSLFVVKDGVKTPVTLSGKVLVNTPKAFIVNPKGGGIIKVNAPTKFKFKLLVGSTIRELKSVKNGHKQMIMLSLASLK